MIDRFVGLRHDAVVSGDDQDGDVGDARAPGADGSERSVARGVQEGDGLPFVNDLVGANVLSDAAGLLFNHRRFAYVVEEAGLAVVNVAQDGDDRRARLQRFVGCLGSGVDGGGVRLLFGQPGANTVSSRRHGGDLVVDNLVDVDHDPVTHQLLDDVDRRLVQEFGQVLDGHGIGQDQRA